jgi:hypothetical protein
MQREGNFIFSKVPRPALGLTRLSDQWQPGHHYLGEKWAGLESDHSAPCTVEVNDEFHAYKKLMA